MRGGQTKQKSDIAKLIRNIPELTADLSKFDQLRPGNPILTGMPEGVVRLEGSVEGVGRKGSAASWSCG